MIRPTSQLRSGQEEQASIPFAADTVPVVFSSSSKNAQKKQSWLTGCQKSILYIYIYILLKLDNNANDPYTSHPRDEEMDIL